MEDPEVHVIGPARIISHYRMVVLEIQAMICYHCAKYIRLVSSDNVPGEAQLWIHLETGRLSCQLYGEPSSNYSYGDVVYFITCQAGRVTAHLPNC